MKNFSLFPKFPAFSSRDFRLYWTAQLFSNSGTQMQFVAINWQIYLITHSALALGLIGLFRFIPILCLGLLGGSVADAHNRKMIVTITQTVQMFLSFVLVFATFTNTMSVFILYAVTLLSATALAFDMPARQAIVPSLVKKEVMHSAMSLNSIMYQTAMIIGPTIAGLLIARSGIGTIYSINALSFIFVLVTLTMLHTTGDIQGEPTQISLEAVKEGLLFVKSKTMIWSTMLLDFFSTFFSSAIALLPIFAKDILQVGPTELGLLYAAPSIGAVTVGFFLAHKNNLNKQGWLLLLSVGFYGLATILFGLSHIFFITFFSLIMVGGADSISTIIRNTIRQLETPDYIRGRMTGINMIFFMGGPQLGDFEAGLLASIIGAPLSVITGGIGTVLVVGIMAATIPALRKYDKHKANNIF